MYKGAINGLALQRSFIGFLVQQEHQRCAFFRTFERVILLVQTLYLLRVTPHIRLRRTHIPHRLHTEGKGLNPHLTAKDIILHATKALRDLISA